MLYLYNNDLQSMKKYINICLSILVVGLLAVSCKKKSQTTTISQGTGWKFNTNKSRFEFNDQFREQETAPGLVFVEGGSFTMGRVQDDIMKDWNNTPTQQYVKSFYIDETEVTNMMYVEYLDYLKQVYPPDNSDYRGIYQSALPDTLVWRNRLGYEEDLVNNYLRHPAYANFPVVGVSWLQAVNYTKWRTDRVNEAILIREGYLSEDAKYVPFEDQNASVFNTEAYLRNPKATYGGQIDSLQGKKQKDSLPAFATINTGILLPEYRLPTEAEWEYAAQAQAAHREYNNYKGRKKYPWNSNQTRDSNRRGTGDQLANFRPSAGDYGGIAGWADDGGAITADVKHNAPNGFGLYGMGGNVAEWVADVYRPIIDDQLNDFNYFRGNVYQKSQIGKDGKTIIVEAPQLETLINGKQTVVALPGETVKVPVDDEDTYLRTNFDKSDNRSYRDGDLASSIEYNQYVENDSIQRTYNSPKYTTEYDQDGNEIRMYDTSNNRTSLVSDEVRVFKGGSWKDRAYWLDPSNRRFLPQYMATDYIGFRCAMSRLGSNSKLKNKTPKQKRVR
jgi:gliding motility-associated lipoprotein GldJ